MTIKEIAQIAGVSISTVSKIVNNKDENINPETRNRVLKIVKEYNYTPYGTVKNLSTAKTFLLGVLLKDMQKSGRMLNGILDAAQERGYSVLLFDSNCSLENELKHITSLCKNKADCILWEPISAESLKHQHHLEETGIPLFHLNTALNKNCFFIDYETLGYRCTEKLIQNRHTKISCLIKPDSFRSQQVLKGFRKCLFDYKLNFHDNMVLSVADSSYFSDIFTLGSTGIVSTHFSSALSLYKQVEKMHYSIPSDLSVVSLRSDGREFISYPSISSFEIPYRKFGYEACSALIHKCEKKQQLFSFDPPANIDHEESIALPSSLRKKKILVAGSINTDITFTVDGLPQTGNATFITNSSVCLGGKGANQSVGTARLGHEVALIGRIGHDTESNFIFDILDRENVSTIGVHRDSVLQTGKAYIYIQKDGEGIITLLPGANTHLSPDDIASQEHLFENTSFCLLSTEVPVETIIQAAQMAKDHNVQTIVKPAALTSLPHCFYTLTDIFIPNRKEAALLCPHLAEIKEQANYFYHQGMPVVIITLGHKGCYLKTKDIENYYSAADFSPVDTTGGADAFISALAVYLSDGFPLESSIRIAQYAAGFCTSRQGVIPALIDKNTLHAHIMQTEPALLKHSSALPIMEGYHKV